MDAQVIVGGVVGLSGVGASVYFGYRSLRRDKRRVQVTTGCWTDYTHFDEAEVCAGISITVANTGVRPVTITEIWFSDKAAGRGSASGSFAAKGLLTDRKDATSDHPPTTLSDGTAATYYYRDHESIRAAHEVTIVLADGQTHKATLSHLADYWPVVDYAIKLDWVAAALGAKPGSQRVKDVDKHMQTAHGVERGETMLLVLRLLATTLPAGTLRELVRDLEPELSRDQITALFPSAYNPEAPILDESLYPTQLSVHVSQLRAFRNLPMIQLASDDGPDSPRSVEVDKRTSTETQSRDAE